MIYVDRKRVPVPELLGASNPDRQDAEARMRAFFEEPVASRRQKRYEFEPAWKARPVLAALRDLFFGKCAYCETPVHRKSEGVDHFRPIGEAVGGSGGMEDGYWWLAWEWFNLYLSCTRCLRAKGVHFPVEGRRARVGATQSQVRRERALLIDPCSDEPHRALTFLPDGTVEPHDLDLARGEMTIEVLGLNRPSLTRARKGVAHRVQGIIDALPSPPTQKAVRESELPKLVNAAAPHAATARDTITAHVERHPSHRKAFSPAIPRAPRPSSRPPAPTRTRRIRGAQPRGSAAGPAPPLTKVDIERIEIRNFRGIQKLTLKPPTATGERAGWMVLLGGNGTGKSTVLQALGLSLLHAAERSWLHKVRWYKPESLIYRGASQCQVRVHLAHSDEPLGFDVTPKRGLRFLASPTYRNLVARGFGAFRIPPGAILDAPSADARPTVVADFRNLFDAGHLLSSPARFLEGVPPSASLETFYRSLKDVLHLGNDDVIEREGDELFVRLGDTRVGFDELSDGYRGVVAMALEIMTGARSDLHDLQYAQGVVLLDELGTHLHPRWKMEIVYKLRRTFPNVQFIATTHEPLCLRGLEEGEVAVMCRDGDQVRAHVDDLPSPATMRVDQLLTSQHFGLHSTLDPELDDKFAEYYELLALDEADLGATENGTERLETLKNQLRRKGALGGILGYTRRDQLLYEEIDRYLAQDARTAGRRAKIRLKGETRRRLRAIWDGLYSELLDGQEP